MNNFFNFIYRVFFSLSFTIIIVINIAFIGDKSIGEVGRSGVIVIALDSLTKVSYFQHLSSPRIDNWLFLVY